MSDGEQRESHAQPAGPFEALYRRSPDPWRFDDAEYEWCRYAITVASLTRRRYRRALEPGCANGALTELLAARCDELVAFDFVAAAAARASARVRHLPGVRVLQARYPDFWPSGTGDLVVWSEVAYYLAPAGQRTALLGLERWLEPGGTLIAVHYTGATDHLRAGADIAPWLDAVPFLSRQVAHRESAFELGVWQRLPAQPHSPERSAASVQTARPQQSATDPKEPHGSEEEVQQEQRPEDHSWQIRPEGLRRHVEGR